MEINMIYSENMEAYKKYIEDIANGLNDMLSAEVFVDCTWSIYYECKENIYIRIEYKRKTYALTPYFCKSQYDAGIPVTDAINNGINVLREEVIRDFGIGQLADFSRNSSHV